jgi:iron complex transport system substrate-binding protein
LTGAPTRRAAAAGLAASLAAGSASAFAGPRRIVSLNPCLDAILLHVADRGQIAALSHFARDPQASSVVEIARSFPITYETAEEVIALRPDLVLTGRHTFLATRMALNRLGVRTELFGVPATLEESLAQVTTMAKVVGRPARGEALNARIRAAVAAAAPAPGERPLTALVFGPGGFASAEGTLMDEMMRRTGFINAATRYGLKYTSDVSLERVIADPPDVLLASQPRPDAPTWADRVLNHPALARAGRYMHRATFPQRLMFCGGPVLIETAAVLARARRDALGARA